MAADKYALNPSLIKEPPRSFFSKIKFLGPGFILSASIVGSGELIATTILGAKAGFIAFWVIIVSCLIKVAIQLEFGRTAITSGATPMQSFAALPGKGKWAVWVVFLLTLLKVIQVGGMLGGSALVLFQLFPAVPVFVWVVLLGIIVAILIFRNYYKVIEQSSIFMVALFTVFTLVSLIAVAYTPYSVSAGEVMSGLQFRLPPEYIIYAIGAFGITGVASDEIIAYNYWCIEKGYAAYTGPYENTDGWKRRANGWISVMRLDAIVAMIIYTIVTAAFYILGAAILSDNKNIPDGNELVRLLANIYTFTLGEGVRVIYLVGAFFVLFSSVFATLAYWTRLFSDIFGQFKWINFSEERSRKKIVGILAWVFPVTWILAYFFVELPTIMILSGGFVGSVLLLLVAYAAVWFRYKKNYFLSKSLMGDIFLWVSVLSIGFLGVYGVITITDSFLS
ncbi:MAG: Nramp family divalent metal transporter [Chitinophagaceae bacterium]|nr:Nramp family divalent metal transporter [Chitinophagaceae bacterium]